MNVFILILNESDVKKIPRELIGILLVLLQLIAIDSFTVFQEKRVVLDEFASGSDGMNELTVFSLVELNELDWSNFDEEWLKH